MKKQARWVGTAVTCFLGLVATIATGPKPNEPATVGAAASASQAFLPVTFARFGLEGRSPRQETGLMLGYRGLNAVSFDVDADIRHGGVLVVGLALTKVDSESLQARTLWLEEGGILDAAIDSQGTYWLATESGLVRLDRQGRKSLYGAKDDLPARVRLVAVDKKDGLWISSVQDGLFHAPAHGSWRRVGALPVVGLWDDQNRMAIDGGGSVWVATSRGLMQRRPNGRWRVHGWPELPTSYIGALAIDEQDRVWVGTAQGGVARRDVNGNWTVLRGPVDGPTDISGEIGALALDDEGSLWLPGPWFDVWRRTNAGRWEQFSEGPVFTSDFEFDSRGALWSAGIGLSRIDRAGTQRDFSLANASYGNANSEILADPDGGAWLINGSRVVHRGSDGITRAEEPFTEEDDGGLFTFVDLAGLAYDARGQLWVGSTYGVARRDADGTWRRVGEAGGELEVPVNDIAGAPDGAMWFATERGLRRLDGEGRWSMLDTSDGLITDTIKVVVAGADGAAWFGTDVGLGRAAVGGGVTWWTRDDGLPSDEILDLAVSPEGHVFAATGAGVAYFTAPNVWRALRAVDRGLPDGRPEQIRFAEDGTLWLGMFDARVVYGRPQGPWSELARQDGLGSGTLNALSPTSDGGAWIATGFSLSRWWPGVDAPDVCGGRLPALRDAQTVDAMLSPDLDTDLYRLEVDEPRSRIEIVLLDPGRQFEIVLREDCESEVDIGRAGYEAGMHALAVPIGARTGDYVVSVRARSGMLHRAERYRLSINVVQEEGESSVVQTMGRRSALDAILSTSRLARRSGPALRRSHVAPRDPQPHGIQ